MKETKNARFRRVAEARVNKIIRMLRLLGNCSGTNTYAYDADAVEQIFTALQIELDQARKRFSENGRPGRNRFSLSQAPMPDTVSYPHITLPLPDGTHLRAVAYADTTYPAINLYLLRDGEPEELVCFAEYNSEHSPCHELCIGVYTSDAEDTQYYLAVADVEIGAFSTIWGNNPEHDLAMPALTRDRAKEDMIFQRLEEWIWSLEHDKPPTMADVKPALALESLARIYGASQPGLPTIEFPAKYEKALRQIALLQGKISDCNAEIKTYEREIAAHSVRIAELMQAHEHGVLSTTGDKLLIDFVTKTTKRPDSKLLKEKYPTVYADVLKTSESRKLKVSVTPT